jgi:hypothetical protein
LDYLLFNYQIEQPQIFYSFLLIYLHIRSLFISFPRPITTSHRQYSVLNLLIILFIPYHFILFSYNLINYKDCMFINFLYLFKISLFPGWNHCALHQSRISINLDNLVLFCYQVSNHFLNYEDLLNFHSSTSYSKSSWYHQTIYSKPMTQLHSKSLSACPNIFLNVFQSVYFMLSIKIISQVNLNFIS